MATLRELSLENRQECWKKVRHLVEPSLLHEARQGRFEACVDNERVYEALISTDIYTIQDGDLGELQVACGDRPYVYFSW